ncbi:hypothetical protein ACWDTD_17820 [Gordonia sp. NPDC003425]
MDRGRKVELPAPAGSSTDDAPSGGDPVADVTDPPGYSQGLTRVLHAASLLVSGALPAAEFLAFVADPTFGYRALVVAVFAVHCACWTATVLARLPLSVRTQTALRWRPLPVWAPVVSWGVFAVCLALSAAGSDLSAPRVVLNASIGVGIAAAMVTPGRRSVLIAAVLSSLAAVLVLLGLSLSSAPVWPGPLMVPGGVYYALIVPVYTVCSTLAVAVTVGGLGDVADAADRRLRSWGRSRRAAARSAAAAAAFDRRSRVLHDTVINTLAAVGMGAVLSDADLIRARCRADIEAIDDLTRVRARPSATVGEVVDYARSLDIEFAITDAAGLQRMLARQPDWRRGEILGLILETVTNAAKHSGADRVTLEVDQAAGRIVIGDTGDGTVRTDELRNALAQRAADAMVDVAVESAPRRGTTVTLTVPPLEMVDDRGVMTRALAEMATYMAAVLYAEFVAVALIATTARGGWTVRSAIPALTVLIIVAAILLVLTAVGRRAPTLPASVVAGVHVAMGVAAAVVLVATLRAPPVDAGIAGPASNLDWAGDCTVVIVIVLVLVDGRSRVIAPALLLAVFTAAPAGLIERAHHGELLAREEQTRQRLARREQTELDADMLAPSRALLTEIAADPALVTDPAVRAAARVEESCLRTAIVLGDHLDEEWIRVIAAARQAGVRLDLHVLGHPTDRETQRSAKTAVVDVVGHCAPAERVTVSVRDDGIDVVADSLPEGILELR